MKKTLNEMVCREEMNGRKTRVEESEEGFVDSLERSEVQINQQRTSTTNIVFSTKIPASFMITRMSCASADLLTNLQIRLSVCFP